MNRTAWNGRPAVGAKISPCIVSAAFRQRQAAPSSYLRDECAKRRTIGIGGNASRTRVKRQRLEAVAVFSPEGAEQSSPGQRPGGTVGSHRKALKGRNRPAPLHRCALSGLDQFDGPFYPGRCRAVLLRPFGAKAESIRLRGSTSPPAQ